MLNRMSQADRHTAVYVGTYPPKECGIASFTMDAVNATDLAGWRSYVIAVDDCDTSNEYNDSKVIMTIGKERLADYHRAAKLIAEEKFGVVCIEHEYGIYGGDDGAYVIDFVKAVNAPVVVTLHTVLPEPSDSQRRIVKELEKHCAAFVVMAKTAVEILRTAYGVSPSKIHVIPHGAPMVPFHADKSAKAQFGLQGRRVISTFGLISPNKGIEDAIQAMRSVVDAEPTAMYLVLGQTHPVIKRREGEWYRDQLVKQVSDLGLQDNVRFVDKYLSLQELLNYLLATDVYITPYYANPNQITSGTLAYAVAAGKVVVSTPYLHAKELLAESRGFLYPFRDVDELARITGNLLTDHALFERTRTLAYAYGRAMTWPSVGVRYARLYKGLLDLTWSGRAAMEPIDMVSLFEREISATRRIVAPLVTLGRTELVPLRRIPAPTESAVKRADTALAA